MCHPSGSDLVAGTREVFCCVFTDGVLGPELVTGRREVLWGFLHPRGIKTGGMSKVFVYLL